MSLVGLVDQNYGLGANQFLSSNDNVECCSHTLVLDRLTLSRLTARLNTVPDIVRETKSFPLGRYCGLDFGIVLHPGGAADAYPRRRGMVM